jgi:predicted Zn-dependent peptidase
MPTFNTLSAPIVETVSSSISGIGIFGFYFHGSSLLEPIGFRGVSHLCEHLLCKSENDMHQLITEHGLETNAATSDECVYFHAKGLTRNVDWYVENVLLRDGPRNIFQWTPSEEDFNSERNVVLQEYEGAFSQQYSIIYDNISRKHFGHYRPIGLDKDLRSLSYEDFLSFFNARFRQPTGIFYSGTPQGRSWEKPELWTNSKSITHIESANPMLAQVVNIAYEPQNFGTFSREVLISDWINVEMSVQDRSVMSSLWNAGGTQSPLMKVIRDVHGLCYSAYVLFDSGVTPVIRLYITVAPENVDKARELTYSTIKNWREHLTCDRFDSVISSLRCELEHNELMNFSRETFRRHAVAKDSEVDLAFVNQFTFEHMIELSEKVEQASFNIAQIGETLVV